MSSSNCCFLTCIQVSQETGQMVWYSHLFKNFSQFIVWITRGGSLSLFQGNFLTQELNWSLLHCRQILFFFKYKFIYFNWRLITLCGQILYQLSYQGSSGCSVPRTGILCAFHPLSQPAPTKYTHPLPQFFVKDFSPRLLEPSLLPQGAQGFYLRSILMSLGHHDKIP